MAEKQTKLWENLSVFLLVLIFVALNHTKMDENDTWWHIALGRWMVQNHQIYRTEIFSQIGLGKPFIAHEWLSEVLFYAFSSPSGRLLSFLKLSLIVSCCWGLFVFLVKPYLKGKLTLYLMLGAAFLVAFRAPVRPQIFEIICMSYLLVILNFWKENPSWEWLVALIPVQILWANLHGSYLLGPVLVFLFACGLTLSKRLPFLPGDFLTTYASKDILSLFLCSVLLLASSLLNPFHFELLKKSFSVFFLDSYMKEYIREWYSVTRVEKGIWFYAWLIWMIWAWISLAKTFNRVSQVELYTLVLATVFPFTGVRYITLSALLSFPDVLKRSYALYPKGFKPKTACFVMAPLAALFFWVGYPMTLTAANPPGAGFSFGVVPTDIIQHIKANRIKGVMMNHYHDGAFILYYLYPDVLPVIDSRTDFYGKELFLEHAEAYTSMPLFQRYVDKYKVNLVLVRMIPETEVLRQNLFQSPGWTLEKFGLDNMLFIKVDSSHPRRTMEEMTRDLTVLAQNSRPNDIPISSKTAYCGWIRLFGHCELAPECEKECALSDEILGLELGAVSPLCFKFSQVCFKKETACGPCPSLCDLYSRSVERINRLGFHYPNVGGCL
ncbi:MAG: hypothetical protein EBQ92_12635 [Proteobacteria bacterium]|nr:hypothetical protein [Pseudomonadota bacterium]